MVRAFSCIVALLVLTMHSSHTATALTKLVLNNASVINGFGIPLGGGAMGDCYLVLDEQDAAGDPGNGKPGHVKTQWVSSKIFVIKL